MHKDIPGYEDLYSIDENGNVWSKKYSKILKHDTWNKNKSHSVRLTKDKKSKKITIFRLLALTFLENPNPELYCNAICINGKHDDIRLSNVMWGNYCISAKRKNIRQPEQLKEFTRKGINTNIGTRYRKMTDKKEINMVKMRKLGYSVKQLEQVFPIKKWQIYNILKKHSCL